MGRGHILPRRLPLRSAPPTARPLRLATQLRGGLFHSLGAAAVSCHVIALVLVDYGKRGDGCRLIDDWVSVVQHVWCFRSCGEKVLFFGAIGREAATAVIAQFHHREFVVVRLLLLAGLVGQ